MNTKDWIIYFSFPLSIFIHMIFFRSAVIDFDNIKLLYVILSGIFMGFLAGYLWKNHKRFEKKPTDKHN